MSKKVIIVGAGLAGLSAGIYLGQSGVETEIFELAGRAGGMCTAWVRKGYRFDGCIHWMVGTKPGTGFNKLYRNVGALEENTVIYSSDSLFSEVNGVMYEIPMEISKFRAFLHTFSEQDGDKIDEFCDDIDIMINTEMPTGVPTDISEFIDFMKNGKGFIGLARKYLGKTVGEFAGTIRNQTIRDILTHLMPAEFSAETLIMMLGTRMGGNAGYPMGGALEMIRRMETKYRELGGINHFNAKVDKIVVEKGKAAGVYSNGKFYPSDAVIAACDAHDTLQNMLEGKYKHNRLDKMLKTARLFDPLALVSFGLTKKFNIPYSVNYECPEGISVAPNVKVYSFGIRSFDFDAAAAPEGCSSVMVALGAPLEYWKNLRSENITEYNKQKQRLADAVTDAVERRIPGFKAAVSVVDVATPATYVRFANLYRGSFEGFTPTPSALKTNIKKTVRGVKNLLICGQWTSAGGGICSAVADGKRAADKIIRGIK
jgi:phytoene dehydrogenase-like protein